MEREELVRFLIIFMPYRESSFGLETSHEKKPFDTLKSESDKIFEKQRFLVEESVRRSQERVTERKVRVKQAEEDTTLPEKRRQLTIEVAHANLATAEHALYKFQLELNFLRPPIDDLEYRKSLAQELPAVLEEFCPKDLPLRFHGSPSYFSEEIIKQGQISSSVDRKGVATSWDTAGTISVTTLKTVDTSIGSYLDLFGHGQCLPIGCLFVLLPRDEEDARSGDSMLMSNADLHGPQLYRVLTSAEMLPRVQGWLEKSGYDSALASEFFAFTEELKNKKIIK